MSKNNDSNVSVERKMPSVGVSAFIVISLIVIMSLSVLILGLSLNVSMTISFAIAIAALLITKVATWDEVMDSIERGGKMAMSTLLILCIIGMVIGSWIASGTVPMIIYWGLKIINPKFFLVTTFIVCCIASLATGSSWSTVGTVGIALMAVGGGMGVKPGMVAGAIVSGAYFGDKLSPLSDSTNLAPAMAEGNLYDHIKAMLYTTIPGAIIAIIVYFILGMKYDSSGADLTAIETTLTALEASFNLNPIVLIPVILVIVLAFLKVPALISLMISAVTAGVLAMVFQGVSLADITNIMDNGFVANTGIPDIDTLLTRGGIMSMTGTNILTIIVMPYGALLEDKGVLKVLLDKMKFITKSVASLVTSTVVTAFLLNVFTGSQYMTTIITGRMYVQAYKEKDLLPQTLSRTIEDGGTMTSALIPWNLCGMFAASSLGVSTLSYVPYAVLNWSVPLIAIFFAMIGKFQWKTGEIDSIATYRPADEVKSTM